MTNKRKDKQAQGHTDLEMNTGDNGCVYHICQ